VAVQSFADLQRLWINAGGPKDVAPVAAAIALAESGGRPDALNPNDNGGTQSSFGLWQISTGTHRPPSPNWASPAENAKLAVAKYKGAGGFSPWGTFATGIYKKFLHGAKVPASALAGGGGSSGGTLGSVIGDIISGFEGGPGLATKSVPSAPAALTGIAAGIGKFAQAIDWFFTPNHWIRIFAGVGGGISVVAGAWALTHVGDQRVTSLPVGVALVGVGGIGLFVAFHNLPDTVVDPATFAAYLADQLHGGKVPA
jgi:hypothetical protein